MRAENRGGARLIVYGALASLALAACPRGQASALLEEGFNYSAGTFLAANTPWSGTAGAALEIVSGNLTQTNLAGTVPAGNLLQIAAGGGYARRNFTATPVVGGVVYLSALIECTALPSGSQFLTALLQGGTTAPNNPDDPLDLYARPVTNGYTLSITHTGADPARSGRILGINTTHFVVLKYTFGSGGWSSLYIDPTPGAAEPSSPDAATEFGDDGSDPANLEELWIQAAGTGAGVFRFDTIRVGTNWADVTPMTLPLTIAGPNNQAVCAGNPAVFAVTATGTPPYRYAWRTNGVAIPGATNGTFTITNPGALNALASYSVVVNDAFGSATSGIASLIISHIAAGIAVAPTNQTIWPGVSNAVFAVVASGDPPLTYQWRTNGVPIPGATNSSYTLANPTAADALNAFDVVVANPCDAVTSTPPAAVVFPNSFLGAGALPGFFSGMNLLTTNSAGLALFCWSSPDPSQSVTNWTLEGPLGEQPLNDGTGNSRYSINVNPLVSPVYYVIGETTSGPYLEPASVQWITTDDLGNYYFYITNVTISDTSVLDFPTPPEIISEPSTLTALASQTVTYSVTASGSNPLGYTWYFNTNTILPGANLPTLTLKNVTATNAGTYLVVITNAFGSITSSVAALIVRPSTTLRIHATPTGIQISGPAPPTNVYCVQLATNLTPPVAWTTIATNLPGTNGVVQFTDPAGANTVGARFYRLVTP